MAGVGVKLNKIFQKNTLTANMAGFAYSTVITVAPMFLVILTLFFMEQILGLSKTAYAARELFSCTILYIFVFALLTAAPFNAVLSRYISDVIYEERYEDILACYYVGMFLNVGFSCLVGIPFCLWEHFIGGVSVAYVFMGFCGYISLVLVLYAMIYLSICKDYSKISLYFFIGMLVALLLSFLLCFVFHWGVTQSMLLSLTVGFWLIAILEDALIKRYFTQNSNCYRPVLAYFKKYWQLVVANFLYILGLYIHNFVFWSTDMRMTAVKSFVCCRPYDMASCLAMFTNISAAIIFLSRVEMHFHDKYKFYSEAVIGGRGADIENTKKRMFRQLAGELMALARIQFIISVVLFLFCIVVLPQVGFSGMTMQIYPLLAAGYFILFLMYSAIIFLYYFNDLRGSVITSAVFCVVTFCGSLFATQLSPIWYGTGVVAGALTGWCTAYLRLKWIEKHIDAHVFCQGELIKYGKGPRPSGKVFDRKITEAKSRIQEI